MINLILFAVLLLIPMPSWAFSMISGVPCTGYCCECPDTQRQADVICEDCASGATGRCGWTIVESGGATGDVSFTATPDNSPALGCTDIAMSQAAYLLKTNTTTGDLYAYKGVSGASFYLQFYIKATAEGLADTESVWTVRLVSSTLSLSSVGIQIVQSGANLRFQMLHHIAAGWQTDIGGTNIALDTWYGVRLYVNDGAGATDTVQWWVDYSNDGSWTDEGSATSVELDRAIANAAIGPAGVTYTFAYYITGIKIDDDAMPAGCAR